jgi:hypothetical protein
MQLVEAKAHVATFGHEGSVKQFSEEFGVKYDTPTMRQQADVAAEQAKAANPEIYDGTGMAPGHTPDVGWGGDPGGPINPIPKSVNQYVGGATQSVPPGTTYNNVQLFR